MFNSETMTAMVGLAVSGFGMVAQVSPSIPQDFKSWPATAMLAFVALMSLALLAYVVKSAAGAASDASKAAVQQAESMSKLATELNQTNMRLNEVAQKQSKTNEIMIEFSATVKSRPCIDGKKQ